MSELNIFKAGIYKSKYPRVWIRNIKSFFYNLKYAWERCTKGFSDYDVWDLEIYYVILIRDSLRHFAKDLHSWPSEEVCEISGIVKGFSTPEDWKNKLLEVADLLDHSLDKEEDSFYKNEFEEDFMKMVESDGERGECDKLLRDNYFNREREIFDLRKADRNKALDWIKEYWDELWD